MSSILVSEKKLLTIIRIVNNFFESDYVLVKLFERNGKFFFFFFNYEERILLFPGSGEI